MRLRRALSVVGGVAGTMTLLALGSAPASATENPEGSAFAVKASASLLNNMAKVDVPATPEAAYPAGDKKSVVSVNALEKGEVVSAHVLNASSLVKGDALKSSASTADVKVLNGLITAKVLTADCTSTASGVKGDSKILELKVAGHELTVTANHPINVNQLGQIDPTGSIWIAADEQLKDGDALTVNALHVKVGGAVANIAKADVVISQAKCSGAPGGNGGGNPSASSTNGGQGGGSLPVTGAPLIGTVVGGLALLGAGVGTVIVLRRRRANA